MTDREYHGLFGGSKIRGGYYLDEAKSAFQKSIRRGNNFLAVQTALRLDEFKAESKAIRSNLLNRIPVLTGEDIGGGCLSDLEYVNTRIDHLRDHPDDHETLVNLVLTLGQSPKSRLVSYSKAVFSDALNTAGFRPYLEKLYPEVLRQERILNTYDIPELPVDWKPEDRLHYSRWNWIVKHRREHPEAFTFLAVRDALALHNSQNKYKIPKGYPKKRNITSSPVYQIWNDLETIVSREEKKWYDVLYKWYLNENENHIYLLLMHVILFLPQDVNPSCLEYTWRDTDCGSLENLIRLGLYAPIEIPDWMIDKHTKRGRERGLTVYDFGRVGGKVENEWLPLQRPAWEDVYIAFKEYQVTGSVTTVEQADRPRSPGRASPRSRSRSPVRDVAGPAARTASPVRDVAPAAPTASPAAIAPARTVTRTAKEKAKRTAAADGAIPEILARQVVGRLTEEELAEITDPQKVPHGQRRTASWKPFVYLPEGPSVWKGPWANTPKNREKMKKLFFRTAVFDHLQSHVLQPDLFLDANNNFWLRTRSLATTPHDEWVVEFYEKDNAFVVDRSSLGYSQLSQLSIPEQERYLFDQGLYKSFMDGALMDIGDQGPWNTLVSRGEAYIIDYDDDSHRGVIRVPHDVFAKSSLRTLNDMLRQGVIEHREDLLEHIETLRDRRPELETLSREYEIPLNFDRVDEMEAMIRAQ